MRSKKTKWLAGLLAAVLSASLLAGCAQQSGQSEGGKEEARDSIVIATANETPSLHPYAHNSIAGTYMNDLTYSTLFRTDANLQPEPNLVETYENLDDTTWQFTLKQGVQFHDGSVLTAEDVKASIEWAKTFSEINMYNNSVESVEVVDESTFLIHTPTPSATLLYDLCHHGNAILSKKMIDEGNDFNENPVGTGPYKLVEWKHGDQVEFEAFEDYFMGAPAIQHMTWKIIPEGSSRTIALEAGEVDYVVDVEAMDVERLENDEGIKLDKIAATNHMWMMVNNEKPGLDNVDVRRAMNCAIDKESIVTVALNGLGTASYSMAPDNMPGATKENTLPHDPELAKEYMEASGVDPASIEMSIICSNDQKKRAGEVIQANLKDVLGIECELENMDLATYLSITAEGDYTAAIGNYSSTDMVQYLIGVYHSVSINASNKTRLNDPEVDALIDQAAATIDPDERAKVLEECIALINEKCPQVPLYQDMHIRAYNDKLGGVIMYPGGTLFMHAMYWQE